MRSGGTIPSLSPRARQALLAAGAFAGGAALAVPLVAPELLRRRILSAIAERTGLEAQLASVGLGTDTLTLEGLTMEGRGLDLAFDQVTITLSPLAALSGDISAIEHVAVRGGHVSISADPADEADEADEVASTGSADDAPLGPRAPRPSIDIAAVAFAFADATGPLLEIREVAASFDEEALEADLGDLTVEGGPTWSLTRASVALRREPASEEDARSPLRLARLDARGAELRVSRDESARLDRLRAAITRVRGLMGRGSGGEGPSTAGLLDRLTRDFSAELDEIALSVVGDDDGASASLSDLSGRLTRVGDELRTEGSAQPGRSGRLGWDLSIEPAALLASGSIELENVSMAVLSPFLPRIPFHEPELAEVSGTLTLERADLAAVRASGTLSVAHLGFSHPRLAAAPVREVAVSMRGTASWAPLTRALTIEELFIRSGGVHSGGALGSGGAEVRLAGSITYEPDRYALDLTATLPRTPCNEAIHAIPVDLLGGLEAITMSGTIGGAIELEVDSSDLDATQLSIRVADGCRFVTVPPFLEPARFDQPFHHRAVENDGDVFEMDTGPGTLAWTPISQVSPFLLHAVLSHEDASFFVHHGFAPWAIRDALVANLREGRYVRGASTITMQLVKNAFLHREKTLARKVQEVLITWWVETAMTKEDILELYLNVIELGDGVYGIRDAAHAWFGRTPAELSAAESVYLAMILPNPPAFSVEHRREGRPPEVFRRRMARFLRHLGETGRYDAAAVEAGVAEIETMRFFHPDEAPPGPRALVGGTSALPLGVVLEAGFEVSADGLESETDEHADEGEASWDAWEEVIP